MPVASFSKSWSTNPSAFKRLFILWERPSLPYTEETPIHPLKPIWRNLGVIHLWELLHLTARHQVSFFSHPKSFPSPSIPTTWRPAFIISPQDTAGHLCVPSKYETKCITNVTLIHPPCSVVDLTQEMSKPWACRPITNGPVTLGTYLSPSWASAFSCTKLGYVVSKIPCTSKAPHLTVPSFKKKKMPPVGSYFQFYIWNREHFQINVDQMDDMTGEWRAQQEMVEGVGVAQFWEGEAWSGRGDLTIAYTPLKECRVQEATHACSPFRNRVWTNHKNFPTGMFQLNL